MSHFIAANDLKLILKLNKKAKKRIQFWNNFIVES